MYDGCLPMLMSLSFASLLAPPSGLSILPSQLIPARPSRHQDRFREREANRPYPRTLASGTTWTFIGVVVATTIYPLISWDRTLTPRFSPARFLVSCSPRIRSPGLLVWFVSLLSQERLDCPVPFVFGENESRSEADSLLCFQRQRLLRYLNHAVRRTDVTGFLYVNLTTIISRLSYRHITVLCIGI